MFELRRSRVRNVVTAVVIFTVAAAGPTDVALAQATGRAASPAPKLKAFFEPVHYGEDIDLNDVFFVTPEVGWVAGDRGTILKTTDGGATWTAQLGGDPESADGTVRSLFFMDEKRGWAMKAKQSLVDVLRTQDGGESWQQVGEFKDHYDRFVFLSEAVGVVLKDEEIFRTADGGRTWNRTFQCRAKVEVEGLSRTVNCWLGSMDFASETVGYAAGGVTSVKVGLVAKTTDGGQTWQLINVPYDGTAGSDYNGVTFIDENTGLVRFGHESSGQLFRTTDGGATWTGVAGSPGRSIRFADPEVGWCLNYNRFSFTTDGGKRWSSREIAFPTHPTALSFPRRDVGYLVGDHGMIFRYRVAPETEPTPPKALVAPVMPPLANAVIGKIAELESGLERIEDGIEKAEKAGGATNWADTPWPQEIAGLQATADALVLGVPELGRKHRNLNLVLLGLQLLKDLTSQGSGLKQAFATLRQAKDFGSAATALTDLRAQLDTMKASVESFSVSRASLRQR